ncbi:MAG: hypothetical protein Q4C49_11315 [Bacillota bacterium]|nr:hypothetical protein [Bacillota bacterium]
MKQLNEEMLVNVSGGDYGDADIEIKTGKPLYQIGEQVEVYNTDFHISTTRMTVSNLRKLNNGAYQYEVTLNGGYVWVYAADIERKK